MTSQGLKDTYGTVTGGIHTEHGNHWEIWTGLLSDRRATQDFLVMGVHTTVLTVTGNICTLTSQ